jgi:hypothetical protein
MSFSESYNWIGSSGPTARWPFVGTKLTESRPDGTSVPASSATVANQSPK